MGCKFNVVSFGSDYIKMFPQSVDYNDETLEQAVNELGSYSADMGGTEIYRPIKDIVDSVVDHSLPRHLYLLTDGEVGDT